MGPPVGCTTPALSVVKPKVVLLLGATAAQAVLGSPFRLTSTAVARSLTGPATPRQTRCLVLAERPEPPS